MIGWRAFWLLVLATACASPSGPAQLTGAVTYRERSALPEGAVVRVTLLDVSMLDMPERVIAEQEIRTQGEQVPIAFALEFERTTIEPGHRYALRASIREPDGRLAWATATAHPLVEPGAAGEVSVLMQRVAAAVAPTGPRLFAYACDGFEFRVEVTQ